MLNIFLKIFYLAVSGNLAVVSADDYIVNEEIFVGEWCVFSDKQEEDVCEQDVLENTNIKIGLVLGFAYTNGKTFKDREYSKVSATVKKDVNRSIGMLCASYTFDSQGKLTGVAGDKHKFISIESYIGTIRSPSYANNVLTISETVLAELILEM